MRPSSYNHKNARPFYFFSNEGLQAAEKGFNRLISAIDLLPNLKPSTTSTYNVNELKEKCYDAINDDMNTAIVISHLFDAARIINSVNGGTEKLTKEDIAALGETMKQFIFNILGLIKEVKADSSDMNGVMQLILSLRDEAKQKKDFATSDKIRDELSKLNFSIKDEKEGTSWSKS